MSKKDETKKQEDAPKKKATETAKKQENTNNDDVKKDLKEKEEEHKEINLDNFNELIDIVIEEKDIKKLKKTFFQHINKIINRHSISKKYLILFLYNEIDSINEKMTDKIYSSIPDNNDKPILLILNSKGGEIEPAYLISKTCKEKSPKFIVVIPRRAKSAATLISLGAHEIHMGSMSELGPIDPQFGNLPALSLSSSLETISKIVTKYPKTSEMFAEFLNKKLDLRILGYFERVSESAMQYAQRLLNDKKLPHEQSVVANTFVYEYKDHSFVIDKEEAKKYLGDMIKENTEEYKLAIDIQKFMNNLNLLANIVRKKELVIVGSYSDFEILDIKKE